MKENNLLLSELIRTGAGHIENAQKVKAKLETATSDILAIMEKISIQTPALENECKTKVDHAEKEADGR